MKIVAACFLTAISAFAIDRAASLPVSLTEQFVFEPGGVVEVRGNFTDLVVEGWDQPDVEVTMTWRDPSLCCAGTPEDTVGYDARKTEKDHIVISAEEPLPGPSRFRIRVPKQSHLVIHEPQKRLSISGVRGDVRLNSAQKTKRGNSVGHIVHNNGKGNLRRMGSARTASACQIAGPGVPAGRTGRYAEI